MQNKEWVGAALEQKVQGSLLTLELRSELPEESIREDEEASVLGSPESHIWLSLSEALWKHSGWGRNGWCGGI